MSERPKVTNSFSEGIRHGVDSSMAVEGTAKMIRNFRLLKRDDGNYILSSLQGTEKKGEIPDGYTVLAMNEFGGVAYLVLFNPTTNLGQLGTFPSPGPNGLLVDEYKPLQNYTGDNGGSVYGDFTSALFKFSLENPMDLELQPDYDGSVNMIYTDESNPLRIANSGFSVLPDGKYEVVERIGKKDSNKYQPEHFDSILQLIQRSDKIMKAEFLGVENEGILKGGNNTYYFKYATSDGNETDIMAESGIVPIFHGDRIAAIRGTKGDGEETTRSVRFKLTNLDDSYASVRVYFVHSTGESDIVNTAYRIDQPYPLVSTEITFVHTGFEKLERIDINELSLDFSQIETVGTIAQSQGYLVGGRLREKTITREIFSDFAVKIRLGHKEAYLDIPGVENDLTRVFGESINQTVKKAGTTGYNGAYGNPKNVHDYLGYWGGEAYGGGAIVFILPDGSLTTPFPCVGVDELDGPQVAEIISAEDYENGIPTAGKTTVKGQNLRGIYRFPNRNSVGVSPLLTTRDEKRVKVIGNGEIYEGRQNAVQFPSENYNFLIDEGFSEIFGTRQDVDSPQPIEESPTPGEQLGSPSYTVDMAIIITNQKDSEGNPWGTTYDLVKGANSVITVNGLTFKIPVLSEDIKKASIGCFFVRGERRRDAIAQGLILPTWSFPTVQSPDSDTSGGPNTVRENNSMWGHLNRLTGSNVLAGNFSQTYLSGNGFRKVMPLALNELETDIWWTESFPAYEYGLYNIRLQKWLNDPRRYAFFSPDINADTPRMGPALNQRDLNVKYLASVVSNTGFQYQNSVRGRDFNSSTLYQSVAWEKMNKTKLAQAHYTADGVAASDLVNELFGNSFRGVQYNVGDGQSANPDGYMYSHEMRWNHYLGLVLPQGEPYDESLIVKPSEIGSMETKGEDAIRLSSFQQNQRRKMGYAVNLYGASGQKSTQAILESYGDYDRIPYYTISDRMYWSDLEDQLDSQRRFTCFRGDAYIGYGYQKLMFTVMEGGEKHAGKGDRKGKGIGVIAECNFNPALRHEQLDASDSTEKRSFFPFLRNSDPDHKYFFRVNKQLDTIAYNHGYAKTLGSKQYVSLAGDSPYIGANWFSGMIVSSKHTPNGFENGYRHFSGVNQENYVTKYGAIRKLVDVNGVLYAVFDHAVAPVPLNERTPIAEGGSGKIFVESAGILPFQLAFASTSFGSQHQGAVVATDDGLFFIDASNLALIGLSSQGVGILSELTVESIMQADLGAYRRIKDVAGKQGLKVFWDKTNREVLFSFFSGNFNKEESFSFVYSEKTKTLSSVFDVIPYAGQNINGRFFSLSAHLPDEIHGHDANNFGLVHGQTAKPLIRFSVRTEMETVFDSLAIFSNFILPEKATFFGRGFKSSIVPFYNEMDNVKSNARILGSKVVLSIPSVEEVTDEDPSGFWDSELDNAASRVGVEGKARGTFLEVELEYPAESLVKLKTVDTYITQTFV